MYDENCRKCGRLTSFLEEIKLKYPDYHSRPVAPFGCRAPALLIVGLAPGMHGANASGRPFTGDASGQMLFRTLHKFGFSSAAESESADDGLTLFDSCITNAVKCVPPQNSPTGEEVKQCNGYLRRELDHVPHGGVILALGVVAHNAVLRALDLKQREHKFMHGAEHNLVDGRYLLDSYHCSRYNTQTKRLTEKMFDAVFARARQLIDGEG